MATVEQAASTEQMGREDASTNIATPLQTSDEPPKKKLRMARTRSEVIQKRKDQFVEFLSKHIPWDKKDYVKRFKAMDPIEMEVQFGLKVIPLWRMGLLGSVIKGMMRQANISVKDLGMSEKERAQTLKEMRTYLEGLCSLLLAS